MDILVINGNDYTDWLEASGLSVSFAPVLSAVTDLDGNTHAKRMNSKCSFTAALGLVPNDIADRLDRDIDQSYTLCNVNGSEHSFTSMQASRVSQYFDGGSVYWDITVSGAQS